MENERVFVADFSGKAEWRVVQFGDFFRRKRHSADPKSVSLVKCEQHKVIHCSVLSWYLSCWRVSPTKTRLKS